MSTDHTYNGWQGGYNTWAVALWINNDEGSYGLRVEMGEQVWDEAGSDLRTLDGTWTRSEAARFTLEDSLKEWIEADNPLVDDASLFSDLLGAALSDVDWLEIADNFLSETEGYEPRSAEVPA